MPEHRDLTDPPPAASHYGTCRSCRARIRWVRTTNGRAMPIDPEPSDSGNVLVVVDAHMTHARVLNPDVAAQYRASGNHLYLPHFATCPTWRRTTADPEDTR